MIILLDSGVLGKLCNPNSSAETVAVRKWLYSLFAKGIGVVTNYLCDYEVRRSLILNSMRGGSLEGIASLDKLTEIIQILPLNENSWQKAAQLWAEARIQGIPSADNRSLDADIIICAQYQLLTEEFPGRYVVIATTNVKHLSRFAEAKQWQEIEF
jgi:predicted nucleic acid-binding protein